MKNGGILLRKIRVALTPRSWFLKTKLPDGSVIFGQNRPGFGGRGIYVFRESIEPEFRHLEKFLVRDGVFLDVGASTGIYTIKAARHVGGNGTVVAMEPFPEILAALYRSVNVNGLNNVRLRNVCAGANTRHGQLWMNAGKPNSFSLIDRGDAAGNLSTLVVALDDLMQWEQLNRLDYLKIDAEGSENDVLLGAKNSIEQHRPIIQAEINISEIKFALREYSCFHAPGSPNNLYIPNEHPGTAAAQAIDWEKVTLPVVT